MKLLILKNFKKFLATVSLLKHELFEKITIIELMVHCKFLHLLHHSKICFWLLFNHQPMDKIIKIWFIQFSKLIISLSKFFFYALTWFSLLIQPVQSKFFSNQTLTIQNLLPMLFLFYRCHIIFWLDIIVRQWLYLC